ncbi:MAG: hypothetical protein AB1673_10495 [Actinomycetota bacterium]
MGENGEEGEEATKGPGQVGPRPALDRVEQVPPALLIVPLVILAVSALVGNAAAPALAANHPLLLLVLNSTTRHLVLTSTTVDFVPYLVVGLVRRSLENPFLYLLGLRYGDSAVDWVARHIGGGTAIGWLRRNFRRYGWPLVALFPGGVVCVLAGASGMSLVVFALLSVVGTVAAIVAIRLSGTALAGPVDAVMAVVVDNWVWLTALSVIATVGWASGRRRRRSGRSPA